MTGFREGMQSTLRRRTKAAVTTSVSQGIIFWHGGPCWFGHILKLSALTSSGYEGPLSVGLQSCFFI